MKKSIVWLFLVPLCAFSQEPAKSIHTDSSRSPQWTELLSSKKGIPWKVRKAVLHGGKQDGVELIEVDNGSLCFQVIPTRGMGILAVQRDSTRFGWNSPVKEVVHPKYVNLQARGGLGWLDGFNEMMCRCGLENNGGPGKDRFINNVGDEATMDLTLHGKIANIPASKVEVFANPNPPFDIHVKGVVHERMFYGPKLELQVDISTTPGSHTIKLSETVTNRGALEQEFELLYHSNYGAPLLEEGARFLAPVAQVTPINENAAKANESYPSYQGPTAGFTEQVYCLRLNAGNDGFTEALLVNSKGALAAGIRYRVKELPYFTLWKNTSAVEEGYVTGLEPGTNFPRPRNVEREHGRVPKLKGGETRNFELDFFFLTQADEVQSAKERIAAIQGKRKPVVDISPEK
ncbi:MAG: DUF4432 family protein [Gemmataceae bacterium]|nr:DUF4432 family protein [Gemmataceae bacterium]